MPVYLHLLSQFFDLYFHKPIIRDPSFSSSAHNASFNIFGVRLVAALKKYDSPFASIEENHRIVMKPSANHEGGRGAGRGGEGGLGERTKKEDLLQTQKPFAPVVGKRMLAEQCEMETAKKRSQESEGGAKEKKEDEERERGEGREEESREAGWRWRERGPCPELPRGLYGSFDLRRSSLLPRSIDTSYFYG